MARRIDLRPAEFGDGWACAVRQPYGGFSADGYLPRDAVDFDPGLCSTGY